MKGGHVAEQRGQSAKPGSLAVRYPQEAQPWNLQHAIGVSHVWWYSPLSPSLPDELLLRADERPSTRGPHVSRLLPPYACLASQLYLLSGTENYGPTLPGVQHSCVPVVLCFSLSKDAQFPPGRKVLPLLPDIPPPQLGEYAFIVGQEGVSAYAIHELPLAARRIWMNLGDLLLALASPGSWPLWVPTHAIASNPIAFLEITHELSMRTESRQRREQEDAHMALLAIESARTELSEVHQAKQKATYDRDLRALQENAQALATAYADHHRWQRKPSRVYSTTFTDFARIPAVQEQNIPTSFEGFWMSRRQKKDHEVGGAIATARGTTQLVISPPPRAILQALFSAVNTLGEESIYSFVALLVLYQEHTQQHSPQQYFFVDLDDLLRVRDGLPTEERVTNEQRARLLEQLATISRIQLLTFLPDETAAQLPVGGGGKNTGLQLRSCVFQMSGRVALYEEGTDDALLERWSFLLGSWQKVLRNWWPACTQALRRLLISGNTLDSISKQLGVFLTMLFHCSTDIPLKHEPELECKAAELCDAAGILLTQPPDAPLALLEAALTILCRERFISRYTCIIEAAHQADTKENPVNTGQEKEPLHAFKYLIYK